MMESLDQYPDEQFLLKQLAKGDHAFVQAWSRAEPLGLEHLRGYGLIERIRERWEFAIPLLRDFIVDSYV
jgi:hypothetical protein